MWAVGSAVVSTSEARASVLLIVYTFRREIIKNALLSSFYLFWYNLSYVDLSYVDLSIC